LKLGKKATGEKREDRRVIPQLEHTLDEFSQIDFDWLDNR
jgi:hypothetical protein